MDFEVESLRGYLDPLVPFGSGILNYNILHGSVGLLVLLLRKDDGDSHDSSDPVLLAPSPKEESVLGMMFPGCPQKIACSSCRVSMMVRTLTGVSTLHLKKKGRRRNINSLISHKSLSHGWKNWTCSH